MVFCTLARARPSGEMRIWVHTQAHYLEQFVVPALMLLQQTCLHQVCGRTCLVLPSNHTLAMSVGMVKVTVAGGVVHDDTHDCKHAHIETALFAH